MKFESYRKAVKFAKAESYRTHRKHLVVKTRYLSLADFKWVTIWTVVYGELLV